MEHRVETFAKAKPPEKGENELRKLIDLCKMQGRMWDILQTFISKGGQLRGTMATWLL